MSELGLCSIGMLTSSAIRGFPGGRSVGLTGGPTLESVCKRTADPSQVGDPFLLAKVPLLKWSVGDLLQYHQVPCSTSRSGSWGCLGQSWGREEGWEYPQLSRLHLGDCNRLQHDWAAEIVAINLKYRLMDKHHVRATIKCH